MEYIKTPYIDEYEDLKINGKLPSYVLIESLQKFYQEFGYSPKSNEIRYLNKNLKHKVFIKEFGTWNNALKEAGLPLNKRKIDDYTQEYLIDVLQVFYEEYGRSPKSFEMKKIDKTFSEKTFIKHFGTWNNALTAAGLPLNLSFDGRDIIKNKHQKKNYKYENINNFSGLNLIGKITVIKTLKIDLNDIDETHNIDTFYNDEYKNFRISTATLNNKNQWTFRINKENVDTIICLAFDKDYKKIKYVWAIPSNDFILENKNKISISDSARGLYKTELYKLKKDNFNKNYHNIMNDQK